MASHCVGEEDVMSLLTILPLLAVVQSLSCPTLCNPMNRSTPDSSVLHYLPVCSNSCPLNRWYSLTITSSAALFFFCLQSFPASGSFPMSRLFASGGQSIGASASAISPSNEYSGLISFRIDWFGFLAVHGTLKEVKHNILFICLIFSVSLFSLNVSSSQKLAHVCYHSQCVYGP